MSDATGGAERVPPIASRRAALRAATGIGALSLLFAALAAVDLANVRPVSGDDALILGVSAHLADTGSLGSPLYHDVYDADEHYFLNLPLQHLLHAAVFRAFGEGVAQARVVSVIAAIVLLCASTLIALRWFGARVAAGTALLLIFWRSGLLGLDYGLPLLAVARSARYDITAVALLWLALLAFDTQLRRPGPALAFTSGALAGAAMLTQFHGGLVLPALAALWAGDRTPARLPGLRWLVLGLVLVLAPYLVYFAIHSADALAQIGLVHDARISRGPEAVLRSVLAEPMRFSAAAVQRGIGQIGIPFALAAALFLTRGTASEPPDVVTRPGVRRLLFVSGAMLLTLALFEPTKAPLYGLPLVPAFCMLLAAGFVALWHHGRAARSRAALGTALVIGTAFGAEGVVALIRDRVAAARVTAYAEMAAEIRAGMEAGAAVLGPAQWSWGLRAHPYEELRALALRREVLAATGGSVPTIDAMVRERRVRFVLLNGDVHADLARGFYGEPFNAALTSFLDSCTSPARVWNDPTYGTVELRAVTHACVGD